MYKNDGNRGFLRFGILTIVSVYILILVGGIVRSTGAGMGCPDWPKCFGEWVPPTDKSQLPDNYKEIYREKRLEKNRRVAELLDTFGFDKTADNILNSPTVLEETDFNPVKTWIEYINRLVGVIIGFLIILVTIKAFPYLKSDPVVFWLSLLSLALVLFQGWLGSIVVSTNLMPFTVTLHMGLAVLLVLLLIYVVMRSQKPVIKAEPIEKDSLIKGVLIALVGLSFIQMLIGTQVREQVDILDLSGEQRELWISQLGGVFKVHRFMSLILLLFHLVLFGMLVKLAKRKGLVWNLSTLLILVLGLGLVSGILLNYAGFPASVQPIHLLMATLLIGVQFLIFMIVKYSVSKQDGLA